MSSEALIDYGLKVVYRVYARFTRDLANSLRHNSFVPSVGTYNVDKSAYMLNNTPLFLIKGVEL